jgi:AcrR family transcriptional regulator
MLVAAGPAGIRLQEVAAKAGLSHPTVLHHFGSREGLIEAVVARALESLHASLVATVATAPQGPEKVAELFERGFETLKDGGHARAIFWLALAGDDRAFDQLNLKALAEAVHAVRLGEHAARGYRKAPTFEDTYFSVLLPALALLSLSIMEGADAGGRNDPCGSTRFRAWLSRLVHGHLEAEAR